MKQLNGKTRKIIIPENKKMKNQRIVAVRPNRKNKKDLRRRANKEHLLVDSSWLIWNCSLFSF